MRRWWAARGLRFRITVVVAAVALVALLALSRVGVGLLYSTLLGAADEELRVDAAAVVVRLEAGDPAADHQRDPPPQRAARPPFPHPHVQRDTLAHVDPTM